MIDWYETAAAFRDFMLVSEMQPEAAKSYVDSLRIFHRWCTRREISLEEACSRPTVTAFIASMMNLSASTRRNRLYAIKKFVKFLQAQGKEVPDLPAELKVKRTLPLPPPPVSLNDQRRLAFGAPCLRDEAIIMALIDSGMRIGECASMLIEDIRWEEGLATIRGKGDKDRLVFLSPATLNLISQYIEGRPDGRVWLANNGRPMSRDSLRANFYRLRDRKGVKAYPHQLRATFAMSWLKEGGSLDALQVAMGHSDIATTARYAAATKNERAVDFARRLSLAGRLLAE